MTRASLHIALALFCFALSPTGAATAPQVLFTDILSGPATGGEEGNGCYLSIFGSGFGAERGDSRVLIGGKEVAVYKYWGPAQYANGAAGSVPGRLGLQQISIQPGPKIEGGKIEVVVGGARSNSDHEFTVRPGKIFFVEPGEERRGKVGSMAKPFADLHDTFHKDDFKPGDFIVLRGGTYAGTGRHGWWLYNEKRQGASPESPYTVYGYPGETVVFDGREGERQAFAFEVGDVPHLAGYVFANLKIVSDQDSVIRIGDRRDDFDLGGQSHTRLVNLDLHAGAAKKAGTITINRGDHLKFFGLYIHDNFVEPGHGSKYTHQLYFSGGSRDVEIGWVELARFDGGVTVTIRKSAGDAPYIVHSDFDMHDMVIHSQTSGPIVFGRSAGKGIRFYNNLLYRNGKHLGLNDRAVSGNTGVYIHAYSGADGQPGSELELDFHHNVVYDCGNEHKTGGCVQFFEAKTVRMTNNIFVAKNPPSGRTSVRRRRREDRIARGLAQRVVAPGRRRVLGLERQENRAPVVARGRHGYRGRPAVRRSRRRGPGFQASPGKPGDRCRCRRALRHVRPRPDAAIPGRGRRHRGL